MDYTDYLLIKFLVIVCLAAVYGAWRGLNGKPLGQEQTDKEAAQKQD